MGCSSVSYVKDDINLRQEKILLNIETNYHKKELIHAQSLINLISRIRNKMIYLYHKLIYDTGACLYYNPTIKHCFNSVFYKLSSDLEGKIERAGIEYIEDPPYLKVENTNNLTEQGKCLLNQLFNFIVEIKSYKSIIKQIDKETPGLLYLVCENKENVSSENIENINRGIELFKNTINIRNEIINIYKLQVREYFTKKDTFFKNLNEIGEKAFNEKIKDIYDIILMTRDSDNKEENKMYKSIKEAKHHMEKILDKEINDDIINSHDSIIIEQKEEE
jgi:hypothetical protein